MLPRILAFLAVIALLVGILFYSQRRPVPDKVSGFIESHEIRVGSRVGGRIASVDVVEGQDVKAAAPLVRLEPFDLQERLTAAKGLLAQRQAEFERVQAGPRREEIAQAQARRDQLAAELDKLKAGPRPQELAEAAALYDQATSQLALAQQNFDRVSRLFAGKSTSQDEMDKATNQLKVAQGDEIVRKEQLALLQEGTRKEDIAAAAAQLAQAQAALDLLNNGSRPEDVAATRAAVASQQATVEVLQRQLAELQIAAPTDGRIEAVDIRPGDLLPPDAPALTMLDTSELWVRAYIPENHLDIAIGRDVRITVDSFPGRSFNGRISFVSRQAEFTPGNVQTPEERSKRSSASASPSTPPPAKSSAQACPPTSG